MHEKKWKGWSLDWDKHQQHKRLEKGPLWRNREQALYVEFRRDADKRRPLLIGAAVERHTKASVTETFFLEELSRGSVVGLRQRSSLDVLFFP